MKRGKLIIYSGPSGSGKGTIKSAFIKNKKYNIVFSISATSRKRRTNEKNGIDYFFLTKIEFEKWILENKFIEWTEYVGNYYGTPCDYVEKQLNDGKNVLLEIEIDGVKQIMKKYSNSLKIFIVPPSLDILKKRLLKRSTESKKNLNNRIEKAKEEMEYKNLFDYVLINDKINSIKKEIINILNKELL